MLQEIFSFFEQTPPVLGALYATLFTWGMTALGASFVFFFKTMNRAFLDGMLGFTGGVMVAASFWSLLAPGIEMSPGEGFVKVIPAAVGFGLGAQNDTRTQMPGDVAFSVEMVFHMDFSVECDTRNHFSRKIIKKYGPAGFGLKSLFTCHHNEGARITYMLTQNRIHNAPKIRNKCCGK